MKAKNFSDWRINVKEAGCAGQFPDGDPWKVWEDPLNRIVISIGNQVRREAFKESIDLTDAKMSICVSGRTFDINFTLLEGF